MRPLFVIGVMLLLSNAASAQAPAARARPPLPGAHPATSRVAPQPSSPYGEKIHEGIGRLMQSDAAGAQQSFRDAIAIEGTSAEAFVLLGEAQRVAGALGLAVESFRSAARFSEGDSGDTPRWHARALQGVAETLERDPAHLIDAREAWQAYVAFAQTHTGVANPDLGQARAQAAETYTQLDQAYEPVRQRIAQREHR